MTKEQEQTAHNSAKQAVERALHHAGLYFIELAEADEPLVFLLRWRKTDVTIKLWLVAITEHSHWMIKSPPGAGRDKLLSPANLGAYVADCALGVANYCLGDNKRPMLYQEDLNERSIH